MFTEWKWGFSRTHQLLLFCSSPTSWGFLRVEKAYELKALSFADDVAWWAEGRTDREVVYKLANTSKVVCNWAEDNSVAFDHRKWRLSFSVAEDVVLQFFFFCLFIHA
jgi:hypothetical protein